jgi:hypothetical protein
MNKYKQIYHNLRKKAPVGKQWQWMMVMVFLKCTKENSSKRLPLYSNRRSFELEWLRFWSHSKMKKQKKFRLKKRMMVLLEKPFMDFVCPFWAVGFPISLFLALPLCCHTISLALNINLQETYRHSVLSFILTLSCQKPSNTLSLSSHGSSLVFEKFPSHKKQQVFLKTKMAAEKPSSKGQAWLVD